MTSTAIELAVARAATLARIAAVTFVAAALATACGETTPATTATPLPAATAQPTTLPSATPTPVPSLNGSLTLTLQDNATSTQCPTGTPSSASCYLLSGSGSSPQLGAVTVNPVVDIEFSAPPLCGNRHAFEETLTMTAGALTVRVIAPYVCLYATGTTQRTYAVLSGTGQFADAWGSGQISFDVLSSGAVETWQGSLVVAPS